MWDENSNEDVVKISMELFVIKQVDLIEIERAAEIAENKCMKDLQTKGKKLHIVDVFFGEKKPDQFGESAISNLSYFNKTLNDEQKDAVKFALRQKEIAIIHGPPGTGKTTTVVETILQTVSKKLKVLACAPSNIAVDNLVEKLSAFKIKMVRLGHPARFLTNIQQYSLDAIVSNYDGSNVVDELRREIDKNRDKLANAPNFLYRKRVWGENRHLVKEVKRREKFIVQQILTNADVVLCTLTSGSDDGPLKHIDPKHFDVCFIDECSQAIEVACWIPILMVHKCILAGDHNQLPPTILSNGEAKKGLEETMMERLLKLLGNQIKKMLKTQYRMNEVIMQWPSEKLYGNQLVAHESVRWHLLSDLPSVVENENTTIPLLLIDTTDCNLQEIEGEDDESKGNEGEADLVAVHITNLIKSGVDPATAAVITPYNLQVDLIKSRLSGKYPELEIKSVDGFQGREKEAIVLSLVRSNDKGEVGFLAEDRRINVAITRARRHVAVICDAKTVSHHAFLKSFVKYCEEKGEVRSAFQYEKEISNCSFSKRTMNANPSAKKNPSCVNHSNDKLNKRGKFDVQTTPRPSVAHSRVNEKSSYHSEEKSCTEKKYEAAIQSFMESNETSIVFPSTLSAFERRVIHEISEKVGLVHTSTGEGNDRCIEVKKKQTIDIVLAQAECAVKEKIEENLETNLETILQFDEANSPSESIPKTKTDPFMPKTHAEKKPAKPKLKGLKLNETHGPREESDFDSLIEQAVRADKTCRFDKCKKSVATLSQDCQFCKGRFCFSHFMPEIHGCTDAVRAHARKQIRKEGMVRPGTGKLEKKVDPLKHAYLQKKLDKKIGDLSNKRKTQKKE